MEAIVWLIGSWVVVGLLSYIFVTRVGNVPQLGSESNRTTISHNERTDWINEIIAWLSTYKSFPVGLSEHWIKSLNEVAKKICVPGQHEVIFEETTTSPDALHHPKISNIESCRNTNNGQLVIKAHLEVPLTVLRVIASENTTITNYNASIAYLEGEIEARLAFIADETYLMSCFTDCPEMKITLANADKPNESIEYNSKLDNTIRKCITSAVMSINFHEYVASLRDDQVGKINYFSDNFSYNENLASSLHSPSNNVNYDRSLFVFQPNQQQQSNQKQQHPPNKIRIKVLKAQRLNFEDKANLQPYVTIELDEPTQKFTSTPSRTVNPQWDQNAEFSINDLSDEVLFEVYGLPESIADKNNKFLGLAIAGLSEMRKSNERVHNLQLQSRPYQNDRISGILTIQSEFFYDPYAQANNIKKKSAEKSYAYNKNAFTYTDPYLTNDQLGNSTPPYEYRPKQPNNYAPARVSINETSQFHNEGHSVLDNVTNRGMDMTELVDRPHREPVVSQQAQPQPVPKQTSHQLSSTYVSADENEPPQWIDIENAQLISSTDDPTASDNERGRSARKSRSGKRERSFFGELRDRLTGGHLRAKKRAKSLDAQNPVLDEAPSEPASRDQSQVRYERLSRGGTLERSQSRTRSPAYNDVPAAPSKLVLELGENFQEKKYYYIPDYIEDQLKATKIMKRGKKLHLCNDHSFVAVKTKGNVFCDVCNGKIATNFVKQAYQCRDCRLVTHKHCHRRTGNTPCPSSTINEKFVVENVNWEELLSRFESDEFISGENL